MRVVKLLTACLMVLFASSAFAQNLKSGNLGFLKGQKTINIIYAYDNMKVGRGTEEEYIAKKVADYNKDKPGRGDEWKKNWTAAREMFYQPKFEELFNKRVEEKGLQAGKYPTATYTMIVRTTFTEPGYNIGISRMPSYTNIEVAFVKTGTQTEEAVVAITKSPGAAAMGFDYDAGSRIAESYAKAGKSLGAFLEKKAL